MVAASFSCSQKSGPEQTVERFFDGVKQYDSNAFEKELYFADDIERDLYFWGLDDTQYELFEKLKSKTDKFSVFLSHSTSQLTYDITSIDSTDKKAEVKVSVTYVDGSDFVYIMVAAHAKKYLPE